MPKPASQPDNNAGANAFPAALHPAIAETGYRYDPNRYRRFSERMTMFARRQWDESSDAFGRSIYERTAENIERGRSGFTPDALAADLAAWAVYDGFGGAFGEGRIALEGDSGRVEPLRRPIADPAALTHSVKRAARLFGASLTGVAAADAKWLYSHDRTGAPVELDPTLARCVVMAVAMDYDGLRHSPSITAAAHTGIGYSRMAALQACMGQFIRTLGYRAHACGNDTALSIPLAIAAGLGELGRNGLLITGRFGPRVRLCKVFTDMPLAADRPVDLGVRRFCDVCMRCAEHCPSRSISHGAPSLEAPTPSNSAGVLKWSVNPETCYRFWTQNGASCSNCIRVCPWNKPDTRLHTAVCRVVKAAPLLNRPIVLIDRLLGYGRQKRV